MSVHTRSRHGPGSGDQPPFRQNPDIGRSWGQRRSRSRPPPRRGPSRPVAQPLRRPGPAPHHQPDEIRRRAWPVTTKDLARTIRLDDATLGRLDQWRSPQSTAASPTSWWDNEGELIATSRTGTPLERNNFARSLARLCERAGIEQLRHTAISHQPTEAAQAGKSPTAPAPANEWPRTSTATS